MLRSGCANENTVAEILEGRRQLKDHPELEQHVAGCEDCRALLSQASLGSLRDAALVSTVAERGSAADQDGELTDDLVTVARGRYEIIHELARGGMGRILEAWDVRHKRPVAIKMLLRPGEETTRRFVREARITARLSHPAIIPLYEAGRWTTGEPFFAMKLVAGKPLSVVLKTRSTLREKLALLPNLIAMTEALAYAHDQRVIHRDLKPSNVLIGAFGETVVIDWGLAKARGDEDDSDGAGTSADPDDPWETKEGRAMGTVGYMAPEQARGAKVDERADVYALGAVLYNVFAGKVPHASSSFELSLERLLAGPPEPLSALCPELPRDLVAVVDKAMAREPADRYASAREMAADMERFAAGQLVLAHSYSLATLASRFVRRHRAVVSMALALVVAVGVTAGVSVRRIVRERDRADASKVEADKERNVAVVQRDAAEKLVGFVIGELRLRLDALGKLDLLAGIGSKVLDYYGTLAPAGGDADPEVLRRRGAALEVLRDVEAQKRNWAVAESLAGSEVDAFDAAHRGAPLDAEIAARTVVASAGRHVLLDNAGDRTAADAALTVADEKAGALVAANPSDPREWTSVAYAYAASAGTRAAHDDIAGAKDSAARAKDAASHVGDVATLEPYWNEMFGKTQMNLCRMGTLTTDWAVATASCSAAIELRRAQLVTEPEHVVHLRELARAELGMAFAWQGIGDATKAATSFRDAADANRRLLAHDPQNLTVATDTGFALAYLCELECHAKSGKEALPDCDEARATLAPVVAARPNDMRAASATGYALRGTGRTYLTLGRLREALPTMEAALEVFKKVAADDPDRDIHRSDLSGGYRDVGDAEYLLDNFDAARASYREGVALDEKQLAEHPAARFFEGHVAEILIDLGRAERARGDLPAARDAWDRARGHAERAAASDATDAYDVTSVGLACLLRAQVETDPTKRAALKKEGRDAVAALLAAGKIAPDNVDQLKAAGL